MVEDCVIVRFVVAVVGECISLFVRRVFGLGRVLEDLLIQMATEEQPGRIPSVIGRERSGHGLRGGPDSVAIRRRSRQSGAGRLWVVRLGTGSGPLHTWAGLVDRNRAGGARAKGDGGARESDAAVMSS